MIDADLYHDITYPDDRDLFETLGLETGAAGRDWTDLGTVRGDGDLLSEGASVTVSVSCWPARFWRFQIDSPESGRTVLETGSGCLSNYWPTARMFADGMLGVRCETKR